MAIEFVNRELIPEGTIVDLRAAKVTVDKQYGLRIQVINRVTAGDYQGVEFPHWFNVPVNKETDNIRLSSETALFTIMDAVADGDLQSAGADLETAEDIARFIQDKRYTSAVRFTDQSKTDKKANRLDVGTIGPYRTPEEREAAQEEVEQMFDDLNGGDEEDNLASDENNPLLNPEKGKKGAGKAKKAS